MTGKRLILKGSIVSGAGEAVYFTGMDWVQRQCEEKLNFRPYPGTLNIEMDETSLPVLMKLQKEEGINIISPDHNFCNAKSFKVSLKNVKGAIIIPDEEVNIHGKSIVEVIAPVNIKETLLLNNGDEIELFVEL